MGMVWFLAGRLFALLWVLCAAFVCANFDAMLLFNRRVKSRLWYLAIYNKFHLFCIFFQIKIIAISY